MKTIVLISCVSKKLEQSAKVRDIYTSPLFRLNLAYAESLLPDDIFVLSAKYGLLSLGETISPYNHTLNTMSTNEIKAWAERVIGQFETVCDMNNDRFVFLAGDKYRKYLIPHLRHSEVPMQGLTIGRQLQFLSRQV